MKKNKTDEKGTCEGKYEPSKPQKATAAKGRLIVLSGPSGSGKSTLTRRALEATDAVLSVSATTRKQSRQEVDGRDYFFLSEEAFKKRITDGDFLEYACVFGHYYGTPRRAVEEQLRAGKTVLLEIDVQGGIQVFEKMPEAIGVFILPAAGDMGQQRRVLEHRLTSRGRDDAATIEKRLHEAECEINMARECGHYTYEIVNDDLERAFSELTELIINAEDVQC